jgi:two-component system chemotaxis response regulator CheY
MGENTNMGRSQPFGAREPKDRTEAPTDVLVVDDEEDIRTALREILEGEGYSTAGASNGAEALEQLGTGSAAPRLILLDLMMPVVDGWEFLTRIDEDSRLHRIPVALMSAHASVRRALDKHREEAKSIRLLLPKPLNLLRVLATVRYFCSDAPPRDDAHRNGEDAWELDEAPTAKFRPIRA